MSYIEKRGEKVFFKFDGKMITRLSSGKFVSDKGEPIDGRKIRGALRNKNDLMIRGEVAHLKSIFNRFYGGDANGNLYSFKG